MTLKMTDDEQRRERRLQGAARSRGYRLVRSSSQLTTTEAGRYLILDAETDAVVVGGSPTAFSATLDQAESFLMDGPAPRLRRRVWMGDTLSLL
jgi:hypothetical protein